jgi:serine/threonine protein kinase/dipeptidyl aminopeptidase/acylaminoacyl peptidase
MLAHYRLVEQIGEGGMGVVWKAEDTKLDRSIALKVLPAAMAKDAARLERFQREAKAVAALNHPNIVTIHSVEESGGVQFLTMELVEGKTLSELIPKGGLHLNRIFDVAVPLADALAAAHQKGITHRDLKPDNIMLDESGRVKVLDFGLAKLREETDPGKADSTELPTRSVTEEGKIVGTAAYMSPEQAEGKPVDARSDVFSLGIILYELATGRRPFYGDTAISTISSILREEPKPLTEVNESLPRHLGRIVKRSLAKNPQRRYQSALDLRNELAELKEEIDSGELAVESAAPMRSRAASTRVGLWLGVTAVVLAAAALLAVLLRQPVPNTASELVPESFNKMTVTRVTTAGRTWSASISPDGNYVAYIQGDGAGRPGLWVQQVATSTDVSIVPSGSDDICCSAVAPDGSYVYYNKSVPGTGRSDLYRIPILGGTPRRVMKNVGNQVGISRDAQRLAFLRFGDAGEIQLMVADADGSDATAIASKMTPDAYSSGASWSPDGKLITLAARRLGEPGETVVAVSVEDGKEQHVTAEPWDNMGSPAWLPDGSGLLANAARKPGDMNQIWFFPYPDGLPQRITNDLLNYDDPHVTADGRTVLTIQMEFRGGIVVAERGDLRKMKELVADSTAIPGGPGLDWTPAGDLVYATRLEAGGLWIQPGDGGAPERITEGNLREFYPSVAPDGRIVFVRESAGSRNLWVRDPDGRNPRELTEGKADDRPTVTPDGEWVLYISVESGEARLSKVPLAGGQPEWILDDPVDHYSLSGDGKRIAVRRTNPESERYETAILSIDGEPLQTLEELTEPARWGPDDEALIYVNPELPVENIWAMPLDGSAPYPLTHFDESEIFICGARWSRDGSRLAVARCRGTGDAILISDFR